MSDETRTEQTRLSDEPRNPTVQRRLRWFR